MPGGGSKVNILEALKRLTGTYRPHPLIIIIISNTNRRTLGLISIVRNSLKLAWVVIEWSFFSSETSHCGAKWTFFNNTHLITIITIITTTTTT